MMFSSPVSPTILISPGVTAGLVPDNPSVGLENTKPFDVAPQNVESVVQGPAVDHTTAPTVNGSDRLLRSITDPASRLNAIRGELRELMTALRDGRLSSDERLELLLNVQLEAQDAAMHWELVSKTVQMGTNSVNTLARTQT